MPATIDGNQVMILLLFWIPWVLAVRELIRGVRHGEMVGYGRSEFSADHVSFQRNKFSFCLLFVLYSAIGVFVPAATFYVMEERGGAAQFFQWSPRPVPPENLPN